MPLKIGKWIKGWKLGSWFKKQFKSLDEEAKKLIPFAIHVTEGIKRVLDSGVADMITDIIPGTIDDHIKDKAKGLIPVVLMKLRVADSISHIDNPEEQVKAILANIKFSSDEERNAFYHSFSSLFLTLISDGKFTWEDSVILTQMFYSYEHKKAVPAA